MTLISESMGPEQRLLLHCSRAYSPDTPGVELNGALAQELDWRVVIELADWHRISPLIFTHLRQSCPEARVPPQALRHFEAAYHTTAARNTLYERELASILEIFHSSRIPVVLLKGSAMIGRIYTDPGIRSMSDLDLLVPENRIEHAERVLRDNGWSPVREEKGSAKMRESFRHIPALTNPVGSVSVELHRELVSPPLRWDTDGVWDRSERSERATAALVPSPEDLLAHVALHFFMDRHEPRPGALRQLVDIAQIVRMYSRLDWNLVRTEGERADSLGALSCGLWAAHLLLSTPVPDWVVQAAAIDASGEAAFIEHRVLGNAPWPLRGLVEPHEEYTRARAVVSGLRRLFPSRRYLEAKYSTSSSVPLMWLAYHIRDIANRWKDWVSHPSTVRQGLLADRFLHSLLSRGPTSAADG